MFKFPLHAVVGFMTKKPFVESFPQITQFYVDFLECLVVDQKTVDNKNFYDIIGMSLVPEETSIRRIENVKEEDLSELYTIQEPNFPAE
jgi:hypothetical protein